MRPEAGFETPPPQIIPRDQLQFETPSALASKFAQQEQATAKISAEPIASGSYGKVYGAIISAPDDERGDLVEYECVAKYNEPCGLPDTNEFFIQERLTRGQSASAESGVIRPICRKIIDGKLYEFYASGLIDLKKCVGRIAEFILAKDADSNVFHEHLVIDFYFRNFKKRRHGARRY